MYVACDSTKNTLWDCKFRFHKRCGSHRGAGVVCSDPIGKYRFRSSTTV